jgi:hypothetical protein
VSCLFALLCSSLFFLLSSRLFCPFPFSLQYTHPLLSSSLRSSPFIPESSLISSLHRIYLFSLLICPLAPLLTPFSSLLLCGLLFCLFRLLLSHFALPLPQRPPYTCGDANLCYGVGPTILFVVRKYLHPRSTALTECSVWRALHVHWLRPAHAWCISRPAWRRR